MHLRPSADVLVHGSMSGMVLEQSSALLSLCYDVTPAGDSCGVGRKLPFGASEPKTASAVHFQRRATA